MSSTSVQHQAVTVAATGDKSAVLRGVSGDLNVVFDISAEERTSEGEERDPLEICLVVDVSGSMMSQNKLQFAQEGVCAVIDELSERDVVHLVAYENSASVVFASGSLRDKEKLKAKARGMRARGGTNIRSGLLQAARCVDINPQGAVWKEYAEKESVSVPRDVDNIPRVKRIFLFSDGQANFDNGGASGLGRLAGELLEAGCSVSSFGIGLDFDELVMEAIAQQGQGGYEYIKKPKHVESAVSAALGSMKSLLGTALTLSVRGTGCAVVKQIYNQKSTSEADLQDLRSGGRKSCVVQLSVSPTDVIPATEHAVILEWKLSWATVEGEKESMSGTYATRFTRNAADVSPVAAAEAVVLTLQAGDMDKEVVELLDKGDRQGALARKRETVAMLQRAAQLAPQGMAPVMLKMAEKNVQHLASSRSSNKMKKAVQYGGRLQRQHSITCLSRMQAYADDSSSEEDDDDRIQAAYNPGRSRRLSLSPSAPPRQLLNLDPVSDDDSGDSD